MLAKGPRQPYNAAMFLVKLVLPLKGKKKIVFYLTIEIRCFPLQLFFINER